MIACLDVFYLEASANSACILMAGWSDATAASEHVRLVAPIHPYEPGHFYRRELPCLLAVLADLQQEPTTIVVDAYVWLDAHGTPGLGARLHMALGQRTPVVGVAKSQFRGAPAVPVTRGTSNSPLFVSAVGVAPEVAAQNVAEMHGPFRVPTLLRYVDSLSKGHRAGA